VQGCDKLKIKKPTFSLQIKIIVLVCGVVAMSLLTADFLLTSHIQTGVEQSIATNATNIARIVARSPIIIAGLEDKRGEQGIQNFTDEIRRATNLEFIVVMDMNGIRKSHPNTELIGQHFVGGDELESLLHGREYTSVATGTLGVSLRAFVPVIGSKGEQIGVVSVGILLDDVQQQISQSRRIIYSATLVGFLVGIVGALALARNIKKTMFGLEPFVIASLLEERIAMLQSVREGVLAIDRESKITLVNKEAMRIFNMAGIEGDLIGKPVNDHVGNSRLTAVLETGQAELDQEQDIYGVTVIANRVPIRVDGIIVGAIATFRDRTEIRVLAEQLVGIRTYAEALRSQVHEFMNKLHVILGMVRLECYDQIGSYISDLAQQYQHEVGFVARRIKDPVVAGFFLGKLSRARELGVLLNLTEDSYLPPTHQADVVHELITIMGNLIDNALEAVQHTSQKNVVVHVEYCSGILQIKITDNGVGMSLEEQPLIFTKGYSTKSGNRGWGLALVAQSVTRLGGEIALSSTLEAGSEFRVWVPYEREGVADD
jgi:CitB family two-component system sensor histidine kinase MalK